MDDVEYINAETGESYEPQSNQTDTAVSGSATDASRPDAGTDRGDDDTERSADGVTTSSGNDASSNGHTENTEGNEVNAPDGGNGWVVNIVDTDGNVKSTETLGDAENGLRVELDSSASQQDYVTVSAFDEAMSGIHAAMLVLVVAVFMCVGVLAVQTLIRSLEVR